MERQAENDGAQKIRRGDLDLLGVKYHADAAAMRTLAQRVVDYQIHVWRRASCRCGVGERGKGLRREVKRDGVQLGRDRPYERSRMLQKFRPVRQQVSASLPP